MQLHRIRYALSADHWVRNIRSSYPFFRVDAGRPRVLLMLASKVRLPWMGCCAGCFTFGVGFESKDEQTGAQACLQAYRMTSAELSGNTPTSPSHLGYQAGCALPLPPRQQPSFGLPILWTAAVVAACHSCLLLRGLQPKLLTCLPAPTIYGTPRLPAC